MKDRLINLAIAICLVAMVSAGCVLAFSVPGCQALGIQPGAQVQPPKDPRVYLTEVENLYDLALKSLDVAAKAGQITPTQGHWIRQTLPRVDRALAAARAGTEAYASAKNGQNSSGAGQTAVQNAYAEAFRLIGAAEAVIQVLNDAGQTPGPTTSPVNPR